jgi:hypothetical protein
MSLLGKIRSLLHKEPESAAKPLVAAPRPTSLTERKQQGIDISVDPGLKDPEAARAMRYSTAQNDNPYETATWEVDVISGRRRLQRIKPTHTAKKTPNNPYNTSSNLDPWKREDSSKLV